MNASRVRGILLPLGMIATSLGMHAAPATLALAIQPVKRIISPGNENTFQIFVTNTSLTTTVTGVEMGIVLPDETTTSMSIGDILAYNQTEVFLTYTHNSAALGITEKVIASITGSSNPSDIGMTANGFIQVANLLTAWSGVASFANTINGGSSIDGILPAQMSTADILLSVENFDPVVGPSHRIEWESANIAALGAVAKLTMHNKQLYDFETSPTLSPANSMGDYIFSQVRLKFDSPSYPDGAKGLRFSIYGDTTNAYFDTSQTPSAAIDGTFRNALLVYGTDRNSDIVIPSATVSNLNSLTPYPGVLGTSATTASGINRVYLPTQSTDYTPQDTRASITYSFPSSILDEVTIRYFNQTPINGLSIGSSGDQFIALSDLFEAVETDLALSFIETPTSASPCQIIDYCVTVNNSGLADAINTQVTGLLPSQLSFISSTTTAGSFDPITGTWTIDIVPFQLGETICIKAQVKPSALNTNPLVITAVVTSDNPLTNPDTTTAIDTVELFPIAPTAVDDYANTTENNPIIIDVVANDSGYCPLVPSTVSIIDGPSNGIATVDLITGQITYTPNMGFTMTDTLQYVICDEASQCDTAFVYITVNAYRPPVAPDLSRCALTNKPITFYVFIGIQKGDGTLIKPVTIVDGPSFGTAIANANGSITYIPNNGYKGPDAFTYQVCDSNNACDTATISLNVQPGILFAGGGRCVPTSGPCVQQTIPPVVDPI